MKAWNLNHLTNREVPIEFLLSLKKSLRQGWYVSTLFGVESQDSKSEGRRKVKQGRKIRKHKLAYYQAGLCFTKSCGQCSSHGHLLKGSEDPLCPRLLGQTVRLGKEGNQGCVGQWLLTSCFSLAHNHPITLKFPWLLDGVIWLLWASVGDARGTACLREAETVGGVKRGSRGSSWPAALI